MRLTLGISAALLLATSAAVAQQASVPSSSLPDAPYAVLFAQRAPDSESSSVDPAQQDAQVVGAPAPPSGDGNAAPLETRQPTRILGIMPNFRSVSGGVKPHPLGWRYNARVATAQAFDYSSFIFLGLTSLSAKGLDEHPALGKGASGLYAYTWRGLVDKTDGTFLSAFLLPSLLHEDTRFYALGHGHHIATRVLYVASRQVVARTYGGRDTPNIAGFGAKLLTQYVSRYYYPTSSTDFEALAEKFGFSVMRDYIFGTIREFYPNIAAHYIRKHREKIARL